MESRRSQTARMLWTTRSRNLVGRASELLQRLDSKAKVLPKVAPQWKRQEEVFGVDSQADAREEVHRSTQRGKLSRAGSFAEVLWREMDPPETGQLRAVEAPMQQLLLQPLPYLGMVAEDLRMVSSFGKSPCQSLQVMSGKPAVGVKSFEDYHYCPEVLGILRLVAAQ
jgi:hypothetical protein